MTAFQSSRNFGFDTDMEMDYTEHSKKRGESGTWLELHEFVNYAIKLHLCSHFLSLFARRSAWGKGKSLSIAIFVLPRAPLSQNWVSSREFASGDVCWSAATARTLPSLTEPYWNFSWRFRLENFFLSLSSDCEICCASLVGRVTSRNERMNVSKGIW